MNIQHLCVFVAAGLLAGPALAQTTSAPLNLQVPPASVPATATSAASRPAAAPGKYYGDAGRRPGGAQVATPPSPAATAATPPGSAPGVYYGDTSGRIYTAAATPRRPACDDSTYNQTQMHGSVGMGVASGGRWGGGTFGGATVNLSKAFGSCEHPTGGISITISGANASFHGH